MAVVGLGVDVVDVARFQAAVERTPGLLRRVLTPAESLDRPPAGLAARFAAKEALAKALGAPRGLRWHDVEVRRDEDGRPRFEAEGTVAAALDRLGVRAMHLSLTHDGGVAVAMVVVES